MHIPCIKSNIHSTINDSVYLNFMWSNITSVNGERDLNFTHTDRSFIPTITRGVLGLHSLISSIRAGSISQRSAIDAVLAKTAQPEIFSHNFLNNDLFYRFPFRCCVNGREWMKLWIACQLFTSAPIVVFIIIHIW